MVGYKVYHLFLCQHPPLLEVLKYMSEAIISRRGWGNQVVNYNYVYKTTTIVGNENFTMPITKNNLIYVRIFGGGGSGGGINETANIHRFSNRRILKAGAGGGGGWMNNGEFNIPANTIIPVTIGRGGVPENNLGSAGGTSSFGTYISANGGEAGGVFNGGNGGSGGGGTGYGGIGYQFGGGGGGWVNARITGDYDTYEYFDLGGNGGIWGGGGSPNGIGGQYGGNGGKILSNGNVGGATMGTNTINISSVPEELQGNGIPGSDVGGGGGFGGIGGYNVGGGGGGYGGGGGNRRGGLAGGGGGGYGGLGGQGGGVVYTANSTEVEHGGGGGGYGNGGGTASYPGYGGGGRGDGGTNITNAYGGNGICILSYYEAEL